MTKKNNVVRLSLLVTLALATCFFVQAAQASTVIVGTCKAGVQFVTIQLAVNASPTGGTVDVCPGTYPEQVLINKKLTLVGIPNVGATQDAVVISPPAGGMIV